MLCPFCLTDTVFKPENGSLICPACNQAIPRRYQDDYNRFPPAVMSTVGFRAHGKTVYLASLLYVLRQEPELARYWPNFSTLPLDMETLNNLRNNANLLRNLELPPATPQNFPIPAIMQMGNIPFMRDSTLLCYDTAGENFADIRTLQRNAGFVARSSTVLFLLSIPDLPEEAERRGGNIPQAMDWLLTVYLNGIAELRNTHDLPNRRQHLVVVYNKADAWVADLPDAYSSLRDYLTEGTVEGLQAHRGYMKKLHEISFLLEQFTRDHLQALNFLNLARANFASVKFCLISALGAAPMKDGRLAAAISPKRVLDPLLLAMENDKRRKNWFGRLNQVNFRIFSGINLIKTGFFRKIRF